MLTFVCSVTRSESLACRRGGRHQPDGEVLHLKLFNPPLLIKPLSRGIKPRQLPYMGANNKDLCKCYSINCRLLDSSTALRSAQNDIAYAKWNYWQPRCHVEQGRNISWLHINNNKKPLTFVSGMLTVVSGN